MHIGHVVGVKIGQDLGLSDQQINCDENLMVQCAACNLGLATDVVPAWLLVSIVKYRASKGHK